jgi:hypothetical protein
MAADPNSWMYQIVAEVESCDAEIFLNDMPIARLREFESAAIAMPVHPSVIDGQNELKIVVNPGPTPTKATLATSGLPIKPQARVNASLMQVPLGQPPDQEATGLLSLTFTVPSGQSGRGPVITSKSAWLPETFGIRPWQQAEILPELNEALAADALGFVKMVADALQKGDAERLRQLFRLKISSAAASYGLDGEAQLEIFTSQWAAAAQSPDWRLASISPDVASLRLAGTNRVIDCVAVDWKPLIRMADLSQGGLLLSMGIGIIDGQWAVVY